MSLCDSIMEDRVSCHEDYATIKCTRDTIKLLQIIKQIMYSNGTEEMHAVHNQVMATINLFKMFQERGQTPQNFRDQFTAMRQVCEQLGLQIEQSEQGAWAILKKKGVTNPANEQLNEAKKQAAEEYHAILFLYLTDQQRYGKAIEDMENNVLNKLDPFPKTVSEACRYLIKWCNNYDGRSVRSEANYGVAFTTVSDNKEEPKKGGKKKEIMCFRCKKVGHYEGNMIPNCNITRDNIIRAEDIFGPNFGSLKGKMTRRPTQHVDISWTSVPQEIIQQYGEVTLAVDVMAINKIPFLMMTSRNIHFGTAELICNKTKNTLMMSIQQVARAYKARVSVYVTY